MLNYAITENEQLIKLQQTGSLDHKVDTPFSFSSLVSGSSGNSSLIVYKNQAILIDAGLSCKNFKANLSQLIGTRNLEFKAILVTHEHSDHILGIGPIARFLNVPIIANQATIAAMKLRIKNLKALVFRELEPKTWLEIAAFKISSVLVSHDAVAPVAYKILVGDRGLIHITDTGLLSDAMVDYLLAKPCQAVSIEANYDSELLAVGPYSTELKDRVGGNYGHLSNLDTAEFIYLAYHRGVKTFLLTHISTNNNFPELALLTITRFLSERGLKVGEDLQIKIAPRYQPAGFLAVD